MGAHVIAADDFQGIRDLMTHATDRTCAALFAVTSLAHPHARIPIALAGATGPIGGTAMLMQQASGLDDQFEEGGPPRDSLLILAGLLATRMLLPSGQQVRLGLLWAEAVEDLSALVASGRPVHAQLD